MIWMRIRICIRVKMWIFFVQFCRSKICVWDPGSKIQDPEKTYSGSWIWVQGSKRHRIPDPQHTVPIQFLLNILKMGHMHWVHLLLHWFWFFVFCVILKIYFWLVFALMVPTCQCRGPVTFWCGSGFAPLKMDLMDQTTFFNDYYDYFKFERVISLQSSLFPFLPPTSFKIGIVTTNRWSGVKMFLSVITAPIVLAQLIDFLIRRCHVTPCKFVLPCLFKI